MEGTRQDDVTVPRFQVHAAHPMHSGLAAQLRPLWSPKPVVLTSPAGMHDDAALDPSLPHPRSRNLAALRVDVEDDEGISGDGAPVHILPRPVGKIALA